MARPLSAVLLLLAVSASQPAQGEDSPKTTPAPKSTGAAKSAKSSSPAAKSAAKATPKGDTAKPDAAKMEKATLGGGCFWCLEAVFERVKGVKSVVSGYAGGHVPRPSYEMVQSGLTGHAEVVQIEYDPAIVSYDQLLEIFWHSHDPTTLNRQGPDEGEEYRSIILAHNQEQFAAARKSREHAQAEIASPIVTEIMPLTKFYKAEAYHQDYYRRNKSKPYCRMYIVPKLQKLGAKP